MAQLNVSEAKKQLDGYCLLVADARSAKLLHVKEKGIVEKNLFNEKPIFEDRAGYFKGTSGGGISDEKNVDKEFKKRFYRTVVEEISKGMRTYNCDNLVILIPEQDQHLLEGLIPKSLEDSVRGIKTGNYLKAGMNDILKTALEAI